MNTKEELVAALNGEQRELPPPAVFTQTATLSQMEAAGCGWPEANFDSAQMVRLARQLHRQFGFAVARVPFCLTVEAERLGCTVDPGARNRQPMVRATPYCSGELPEEVPALPAPDEYVAGGRLAVVRAAAEQLRREEPDVLIVASMVDPFALSCHLLGTENLLMGLMLTPDLAAAWPAAVEPLQCAYAAALAEVADNVVMITEGESDILPPDQFDTFIGAHAPHVVRAMKGAFSTVHCCGDTSEVREKLAGLGETCLSIETHTDPEGILAQLGGKVRLAGGIKPVDVLLQGTPDGIRQAARHYAALGYPLITPECGVPPQTPDANLRALADYRH